MDGVGAVRQFLGFGIAFLVTYKGIADTFVCVIKTPCAFEPELKRGSFFGCFNFGLSLIGVLDDFNIALDNILGHAYRDRIMLNGVVFRFSAYIVNSIVEQIALGRLNLSDSPIITTDIFLRGEFAVLIGGVGINQFVAVIDTVLCSGKGSVALRLLGFGVYLCNLNDKLFECIGKFTFSVLIPNDGRGL